MIKTIKLPEFPEDITIKDYLFIKNLNKELTDIEKIKEVFMYFSKLKEYEINGVDFEFVVTETDRVMNLFNELQPLYQPLQIVNGIHFGLIPDFNKIDAGLFIDISKYQEEETFSKLIACLFRPIKNNSTFELEKYNGTKHVNHIEQMPYVYALGGLNKWHEFINEMQELYPEIYSGGGSSEEMASSFFEKWGWYATIFDLAKGNILKIDKVLDKNIHEFHLFLAHKIDKQKLKERLMKSKLK